MASQHNDNPQEHARYLHTYRTFPTAYPLQRPINQFARTTKSIKNEICETTFLIFSKKTQISHS